MSRLRCVVPHCNRTTGRAEFEEWMCGIHWKMLPKDRRRAYGRHVRRWRRFGDPAYGPAAGRLWRRLKRQAIETAMGI